MKKLIIVLLALGICPVIVRSQQTKKANTMPGLVIAANGDLEITASAGSSKNDFDFMYGTLEVNNHKLIGRLINSNKWTDFPSKVVTNKILDGVGDMGYFFATFDGKPFKGITLRLFNPQTRLWSAYWAATDEGILQPPTVGSFDGNIGTFYAKDVWEGKNITVRITWDKTDPRHPIWKQAFSTDKGKSWEVNWIGTDTKVKTASEDAADRENQ